MLAKSKACKPQPETKHLIRWRTRFDIDISSVFGFGQRTRVPGQAALRAVGRALVQRVLEGPVVVDGGSVVLRRSGFLAQLAVLAVGALQACIRYTTRHDTAPRHASSHRQLRPSQAAFSSKLPRRFISTKLLISTFSVTSQETKVINFIPNKWAQLACHCRFTGIQ